MVKKQMKKYPFAKNVIAFIKAAGKEGVTRKKILVHIGLDKKKGYTDFDTWFNRDGAESYIGKRGSGMGSTYAYYWGGRNMPQPEEKKTRAPKGPKKPTKVTMTIDEYNEALLAAKTEGSETTFNEMAADAEKVQARVRELEGQVRRLEEFKPRALAYDLLVSSLSTQLAQILVEPIAERVKEPVVDRVRDSVAEILATRITAAVATPIAPDEGLKPTTIAEAVSSEEGDLRTVQPVGQGAGPVHASMRSPFTVGLIGFNNTEAGSLMSSGSYKHAIDKGLLKLHRIELTHPHQKVHDVSYVLVNVGSSSPHRVIPKPIRDQITSRELLDGRTADTVFSARKQIGEFYDQHPLRSMEAAPAQ